MRETACKAILLLGVAAVPATASAGMPSDPLSPEMPPTLGEVSYDMGMIRQDLNNPRATLTLGHADNGAVTARIDGQAGTLTVQKGAQAYTFTFSQISQQAFPNDAYARQDFVAGLNELAFDRGHIVSFDSYSSRSGVGFDDGLTEPACAFVPCRRIVDPYDPQEDHWVTTLDIDWYPPQGPWYEGQYSQEVIEYDKARWRQHVAAACERAHTWRNSRTMVGRLGSAGAACLAAPWGGLTASACATAAGSVLEHANTMGNDDTICHNGDDSDYPGPGRW